MSAAYLCAGLEITNTPRADHAQYVASWLTVLTGDTKAIFTAASLATRAVDYLYGLQPKPETTPNAGTAPADGMPSRPQGDVSIDARHANTTRGPR